MVVDSYEIQIIENNWTNLIFSFEHQTNTVTY